MGAALTGHVTDGISNRHLNKYYFPPLKVVTLLGSSFIGEPFVRGEGAFMSGRACGLCTCESLRRLSRVWIIVGKPKRTAFDFHWFKLGSNCCGDPVGDSFMSCLFKLPFFPPDQNGPVHVRSSTPPQARTHRWLEAQQHWREAESTRPSGFKNQRLDHRCVCPGTSTVAEGELFDLLSVGQAKGLQSAKQIRLSLLRLVTLFTPALPHHLANDAGLS